MLPRCRSAGPERVRRLACQPRFGKPNFRAFATGGVNSSGTLVLVNPDLAVVATGGFNPTSTPPGAPTLGVENTFYIGEMDLVVRVSRAHTIWFDSGAGAGLAVYSSPIVEPKASDQPTGTQVVLAYRGASNVTGFLATNSNFIDPYGDRIPNAGPGGGTVTYFNGDSTWRANLPTLNGARFFQVRISFIANAATGRTPEVSALGFAFAR